MYTMPLFWAENQKIYPVFEKENFMYQQVSLYSC